MESWPHERAAVVSTIDPQLGDNTTLNGDYVDLAKFHEVMFVLLLGASDITVDFSVRESRDTGGTGEQALKSATQLTSNDDNKQVVISVKSEELTQTSAYRYVRPRVVIGDGATGAYVAVVALGMRPRFGPASDDDLADVAQIVS